MDNIKKGVRMMLYAISFAATVFLLGVLFLNVMPEELPAAQQASYPLMSRFREQVSPSVGESLEEMLSTDKVYWIPKDATAAPKPDAARFGSTSDPSTLQWLLDEAEELLDGQELYFSTETQLIPGYQVHYYLDETILAISWKENINWMSYTVTEVKLAHPSQFRRYLAGGEYGSQVRLTTTQLADQVNAVVASAGDYYTYRKIGTNVYDGELMRFEGTDLDVCFVDEGGNLILSRAGDLKTPEETEQFIQEHNIQFGLAFGPILVENGERCEPYYYRLGEINDHYSRAGIGQKGELHYILVTVNEEYYKDVPTIHDLAAGVMRFGCDSFYTLDGGHTATIAMNGRTMNRPDYGYQRQVSDIIYFASAVPRNEESAS